MHSEEVLLHRRCTEFFIEVDFPEINVDALPEMVVTHRPECGPSVPPLPVAELAMRASKYAPPVAVKPTN